MLQISTINSRHVNDYVKQEGDEKETFSKRRQMQTPDLENIRVSDSRRGDNRFHRGDIFIQHNI